MGVEPPFLYDPINRSNPNLPFKAFEPKAITKASLAPRPSRPKHDGPLITSTRNSYFSSLPINRKSFASSTNNSSPTRKSFASVQKSQFDRHPDSWSLASYGNSDAKSMSPKTKMKVTRWRFVQLALRCLELLGAVALLVVMIFISNIPSKIGLIIRIPPGVAILHTVYAIYHLSRRPSGRTPGSSSSYMFFAACFDLSLIPFYAFTAILSHSQHTTSESGTTNSTEWSTLLPAGRTLLPQFSESAFLLAIVTGGLQLISMLISIYLGIKFWQINNLPPDMNPLEDNLTSRYKKPSKSTTSFSAVEKRLSEPLENKRSSGAVYEDLLRPPTVPFHHNATGSTDSFSTYHATPPPSRGQDMNFELSRLDLQGRQYGVPSPRSSLGTQVKVHVNTQNPVSYTAIPLSDDNQEPISPTKPGNSKKDIWFASDSFSKTKKPVYEPIAQQTFDDFNFSFRNGSNRDYPESNGDQYHLSNSPTHSSYTPTQTQPRSQEPLSPTNTNKRKTPHDSSNNAERPGVTRDLSLIREESIASPYSSVKSRDSIRGKRYGDLRAGTPPIMVGSVRQISTGTDLRGREVSGKVVEEGRGGWGERFRRVSGRA